MSGLSSLVAANMGTACRLSPGRDRRPVRFEVEGCALHGMLDLPPRLVQRRTMGVLFLNSDDGCRLGPHSLWVRLADRLTAEGFPCMRFDYRGCGDSEGPEGSPLGVVGLTDAIAAERAFRKNADVTSILLIGICYGAEIALLTARCLPTVRGVVACSAGRYVTRAGYGQSLQEATQYTKKYLGRLAVGDTWRRLLRGDVHPGVILTGLLQRLSWTRRRSDRRGAADAEALAKSSTSLAPQLFIYGGADPLTSKYMPGYQLEAKKSGMTRRFLVITEADHNFSSVNWSGEVIETAVEFVLVAGRSAEGVHDAVARIG